MVSIACACARIKSDPLAALDSRLLENICIEMGLEWRRTVLTPPATLACFIRQVIDGNVSCEAVSQASDGRFTAQGFWAARQRLALEVIVAYSRRIADAAERESDASQASLFHGHRTWHIDGSSFSMPDTPELQEQFGQPGGQKAGCGFPVAHLLTLFSAATGLLRETIVSPMRTHDLSGVARLHDHLLPGDLVIGDCAFGSYAHFGLLLQKNLHGLFPAHQARLIDFTSQRPYSPPGSHRIKGRPASRWIKSLGKEDQLVEWFRPRDCPSWMTQAEYDALPKSIIVREIRRTIHRAGFGPLVITIVTTLLDPEEYPADELIELQAQRWGIEINLRHLKTTMGLDVLHCKTVEGVNKELAVFTLVYNLVRLMIMEAANRQCVPVDRISFKSALHWIRHGDLSKPMPKLKVNPARPGRIEPRAIKRRHDTYARLNKPRAVMREALRNPVESGAKG